MEVGEPSLSQVTSAQQQIRPIQEKRRRLIHAKAEVQDPNDSPTNFEGSTGTGEVSIAENQPNSNSKSIAALAQHFEEETSTSLHNRQRTKSTVRIHFIIIFV